MFAPYMHQYTTTTDTHSVTFANHAAKIHQQSVNQLCSGKFSLVGMIDYLLTK